MTSYQYCDPPIFSIDVLEGRTIKGPKMSRSKIYSFLQLCIGIWLGYFIIQLARSFVLGASQCSSEPDTRNNEKFTNSKKSLIYVGVMTANKYLSSRAKAVYETWGKDVPGDISFFSAEHSKTDENIPLVKLKGVADIYPPQKKAFLMLKYMYDHHLNDYEFFMRADDDVYIKTDRLEKFLKSINSSKLYYIGQPGKGTSGEIGFLSLTEQENFCMGGTGMIFTRATLEKLAPHIKKCLKNLKTLHEDVEIGRCVQKFVGIPCTWSYEMQDIFYNNGSGTESYTGSLKQREVHRAITLHPIKQHLYLYRLHAYILSRRLKEQEFEMVQTMREAARMARTYDLHLPSLDDPQRGMFIDQLGVEASLQKWRPRDAESVLEWDFYRVHAYQLEDSNPLHRQTAAVREAHRDVTADVMETLNRVSKERGRVIVFKDTLYGYGRRHPSHSAEFVLDMLLLYKKYAGKKITMPVRRHAYLQVPFGPLMVRDAKGAEAEGKEGEAKQADKPGGVESIIMSGLGKLAFWNKKASSPPGSEIPSLSSLPKKITFILPLAGKWAAFQRFMGDFRRVCLAGGERVRLIVVTFRSALGEEDSRRHAANLVKKTKQLHPEAELSVVQSDSPFARALAMELGAGACEADDLLFFVDVDMTFSAATLDKIRVNTVQGRLAYFPVVFSEFDPKSSLVGESGRESAVSLSEVSGYWRRYGYGIAALYKSDLVRVGGFDTSIVGWGKEDVDLYDKVIKSKYLGVIRSADPDLVHIFHQVACDAHLEAKQLSMCEGSRLTNYEAASTLSRTIIEHPEILMFKRVQQD